MDGLFADDDAPEFDSSPASHDDAYDDSAPRDVHPRFTPNSFGHESIESRLLINWAQNKLANAYMFTGPRGIGKSTMAHRFAQFILCQDEKTANDAGGLFGDTLEEAAPTSFTVDRNAHALKRMSAGSHTDFLLLEPAFDEKKNRFKDDITVEQSRKISGLLSLTSAESKHKIVIVDPVDALNNNAANAILKWLEEPPSNTIFILIAHNPGVILPTIRSRCRVVAFPPLDMPQFTKTIADQRMHIEESMLKRLHTISGGSPGVAMELYIGGAVDWYDGLIDVLFNTPNLDQEALVKFAETAMKEDVSWNNKGRIILALLSQITQIAAGRGVDEIYTSGSKERVTIQKLAALRPVSYWIDAWDEIRPLHRDTARLYLDRKQALQTIILKLAGAI